MNVNKLPGHEWGLIGHYKYLSWREHNTFTFCCYFLMLKAFKLLKLTMHMYGEELVAEVLRRFSKYGLEGIMVTSGSKQLVVSEPGARKLPRMAQKAEERTKFRQETVRIP